MDRNIFDNHAAYNRYLSIEGNRPSETYTKPSLYICDSKMKRAIKELTDEEIKILFEKPEATLLAMRNYKADLVEKLHIATFNNSTSYNIPDNNGTGVSSPITVTGVLPATIGASSIASVCINLNHTWDSDLDIYLRCLDGTLLELSTDNGGGGDKYTNTCFTPTAGTAITAGTAPFTGNFSPEQAFTTLNGCTANGTWQLVVRDDSSFATGNIVNWTINFNNNIPAFVWSPTTNMTNANTLTPNLCLTTTTTYTLTANNGIVCTVVDTVTITVTAVNTVTANAG